MNGRKIISEYKGFQIKTVSSTYTSSNYLAIFKDDERVSSMALTTIKACENVINTHLRTNRHPDTEK